MIPVKIDSSFKLNPASKRFETEHHWGELRLLKDTRKGDYYLDVLSGKKGKDPHIHLGVNFDGTFRFVRSRGRLHTIERKLDTVQRGFIESRKDILRSDPPGATFTFKMVVDELTKTISVLVDEATLSEA